MRTALEDGRLQVTAAASLLDNSRLVKWIPQTMRFAPVVREAFESSWRDVDPVFGRLTCWIMFSAGAEFLAKGTCLVNDVDIRYEQDVPLNPSVPIPTWARQFRESWRVPGTTKITGFGTMRRLTSYDKKKLDPALTKLCSKREATADEEALLLAAYEFLQRAIRNRDVHAYLPNARDSHFSVVAEIFVGCFNMLMKWLPGGPTTLNTWRSEAGPSIDSL